MDAETASIKEQLRKIVWRSDGFQEPNVFLPTQANPTQPHVEAKFITVYEPSPDELEQQEALETIMAREQETIAALPVVTPA